MKQVFLLLILLVIFSCSPKFHKEDSVVSYSELPRNVQIEFSKIGKTVNLFMDIKNTDNNCRTTIGSGSPIHAIMPRAYLVITTCTEKYRVDFSITSARYFVLDNQKLFFTKSTGFSQKIDAPLNESLTLKNLKYGVIRLKE